MWPDVSNRIQIETHVGKIMFEFWNCPKKSNNHVLNLKIKYAILNNVGCYKTYEDTVEILYLNSLLTLDKYQGIISMFPLKK